MVSSLHCDCFNCCLASKNPSQVLQGSLTATHRHESVSQGTILSNSGILAKTAIIYMLLVCEFMALLIKTGIKTCKIGIKRINKWYFCTL